MIRPATIRDLERMTEIYNQAIRSRIATGDMDEFSVEQRRSWFEAHADERNPLYVYEDGGKVAGYCGLSAYRPGRRALEGVAEISYYIDYGYHRKGIGSRLLRHGIQEAGRIGYRDLIAILLSSNTGSMALLEKHGFQQWGKLPDIAHLDNQLYSHYYYGLKLAGEIKTIKFS